MARSSAAPAWTKPTFIGSCGSNPHTLESPDMSILTPILYVLFSLLSILLTALVLVQEGKGGGLGGAFGGAGAEMFGHGAGGINKATGVLAGVLFLIAIVIGVIEKR